MALEKMDAANLQSVIDAEGAQWQAGVTPLSELSEAEKQLRLGYFPGPDDESLEQREQNAKISLAVFKSAVAKGETIGYPASYDLRNVGGKNFITSVKDQAACGSCVAFGTVATVEGTLRFSRNDPNLAVDLSEAHLFYCHARSQGRRCSGSNGGWWVDPALDCFKNPGVADEPCYPYTGGDQECKACSNWQSRVTKVTGWHKITNVAQMKEWLSSRGPLASCFTVYNDFFSYRSGIYRHVTGGVAGGHCISVVGYNDTQGYWICKNSWNTSWGESGFFRIAYGECGIDSTMWAIDGIESLWENNKKILGLWANDQNRNAWVYVDQGVGWRKISTDNDNIFLDILVQLIAAKAGNRPVNFRQEGGVIKEIYVL
jgi:C1A family cysteine protease